MGYIDMMRKEKEKTEVNKSEEKQTKNRMEERVKERR